MQRLFIRKKSSNHSNVYSELFHRLPNRVSSGLPVTREHGQRNTAFSSWVSHVCRTRNLLRTEVLEPEGMTSSSIYQLVFRALLGTSFISFSMDRDVFFTFSSYAYCWNLYYTCIPPVFCIVRTAGGFLPGGSFGKTLI